MKYVFELDREIIAILISNLESNISDQFISVYE